MLETPTERETFYDTEIAPVLLELGQKCEANGLSFIAHVEWDPAPEEYGSGATATVQPDASVSTELAFRGVNARGNLDAMVISMMRYCAKKGIDTSSSIVARILKTEKAV